VTTLARRDAVTPNPSRTAHLDRVPELRTGRNFLRAGDPCRVKGEFGVFRFVEVVTNTVTGAVWADVVGPIAHPSTPGIRPNPHNRSFRPDRLRRVARS